MPRRNQRLAVTLRVRRITIRSLSQRTSGTIRTPCSRPGASCGTSIGSPGALTTSDLLVGEDGNEDFLADEVPYDSVSVHLNQTPLRTVTVDAEVGWSQRDSGSLPDLLQFVIHELPCGFGRPGMAQGRGKSRRRLDRYAWSRVEQHRQHSERRVQHQHHAGGAARSDPGGSDRHRAATAAAAQHGRPADPEGLDLHPHASGGAGEIERHGSNATSSGGRRHHSARDDPWVT